MNKGAKHKAHEKHSKTTRQHYDTRPLLRKGEIREHYSISKQSSMATIGIAAVLTILFIAALLWT